MKKICLIGAFDTKGPEYAFAREQIIARGKEVLTVNTGVLGSTTLFPVEADEVAEAGAGRLDQFREYNDRGVAMKIMSAGAGGNRGHPVFDILRVQCGRSQSNGTGWSRCRRRSHGAHHQRRDWCVHGVFVGGMSG